ncbi:MAG: D-alanyl-D-alanine carboxypeptidase/D-alanyl-D-alanine-endopeptidase [Betaproteobacteria bacterium]
MFHRFIAIYLLCAWTSFPVAAQAPLPPTTSELLRAANIPADAMGAIAVRVDDGTVILAHDADRALQPASTMKTLTAIVALEQFGPAWRARTTLQATANILHGRLDGDLFLRGGGSPDFDWTALAQMLRELRLAGIRRITGDVVVDRGLFRPARDDIAVPPFDETPEFRYNVIPDALELNTNLLRIDLVADAYGLHAMATPALDRVDISTRGMTLVERACDKWEDGWKLPAVTRLPGRRLSIALQGDFPRDCKAATAINVLDRAVFAGRLFRKLWRDLGGRFDGVVREGDTPAAARVLAGHKSRTLAESMREILKRSDNPITRQVYLTLGTLPSDDASASDATTAVRAERIVRRWLAGHSLDGSSLVLENGSGLSRREKISPRLLAGVLAAAAHSRWSPEFESNLPIVAVDGGMEKRLRESPAAQRARIKTGSLRNVVSVAGYVPDAAGRLCVVVAILNHDGPDESWKKRGRDAVDSVIDWVAHSR